MKCKSRALSCEALLDYMATRFCYLKSFDSYRSPASRYTSILSSNGRAVSSTCTLVYKIPYRALNVLDVPSQRGLKV